MLNISFVDVLNSIRWCHDIFGKGGFGINFGWAAQLTCGAAASSTPALCLKASPQANVEKTTISIFSTKISSMLKLAGKYFLPSLSCLDNFFLFP